MEVSGNPGEELDKTSVLIKHSKITIPFLIVVGKGRELIVLTIGSNMLTLRREMR